MKISVICNIYNSDVFLENIFKIYEKNIKGRVDTELIIIDDCSKDSTSKILKSYGEKENLKLILNEVNLGISASRNIGISYAKGKYVLFWDGDDSFEDGFLDKLFNVIKIEYDLVQFNYSSIHKNLKLKKKVFLGCNKSLESFRSNLIGEPFLNPINLDRLSPVWGKLYRREIIKDIKFIDLKIIGTGEDLLFNIEASKHLENFIYLEDEYLYIYNRQNSSSITSNYKETLLEKWMNLFSKINKNINGKYSDLLSSRIETSIFSLSQNNVMSNKDFNEKLKAQKEILNFYKNPRMSFDFKYAKLPNNLFYFYFLLGRIGNEYIFLIINMFIFHVIKKIRG